ncbi:hypothetical protein [Listeria seeligeri]|uniref:hypothetical protein n=1 Tax=Listeria seeligeri TaxID=1640 RepID=UPI0010DE7DCA|nr:hypothetical protein [Listeria seeligeri]EAD5177121.1 hypothetical protein [Listeria monocytogenes]EIE7838059.1 hypothetical protein [Listeria monocytogenes]EKZ4483612.1 hypothetical protein [Listeria monocytogenes]HAC1857116.1 hypothetical protein [Listeria monocytogenes]
MAGYLRRYAENKGWTLYKLAKESHLSDSTLRTADLTTLYKLSVINVKKISEAVGESPGKVLDDLFKIEEEIEMENTYYYNKDTDTLLTGVEYDRNIERYALERWEEVRNNTEEREAMDWNSVEDVKQTILENESDFVISDGEGNPLTEW